MHRRFIICGRESGEQYVCPRNKAKAQWWPKPFDVESEVLGQHLDTNQEYSSDPESTPRAVPSARNAGMTIVAAQYQKAVNQRPRAKRSCLCQLAGPQDYLNPNNKRANVELRKPSMPNVNSMPQGCGSMDRYNIEVHRCCGALIQENLYSQMRKNYVRQQAAGAINGGTVRQRNLEANQATVPRFCRCRLYPIQQNTNTMLEESTSPVPVPVPAACICVKTYSNSPQRAEKSTQNSSQPKLTSSDRVPCFAYSKQQLQTDDSAPATSTSYLTTCTTTESHQEKVPEVKNKSIQAGTYRRPLKNQSVQCGCYATMQPKDSSAAESSDCSTQGKPSSIQPKDSSAAESSDCSTQGKPSSILKVCDCRRFSSSEPCRCDQRLESLAMQQGRNGCTSMLSSENTTMSNIGSGGEEQQQYSVNAVNVLLMNGSRRNTYEGPNPEICVLQSDLAGCNERAVFPEVDKPFYRVCRACTSGPNTKGTQDEANVLVLEEDPMDGICSDDNSNQGQSSREHQFVEEWSDSQHHGNLQQFVNHSNRGFTDQGTVGGNWIDSSGASNYTRLLELQRARINELESLLQQHNQLQQTIQTRMAELQYPENGDNRN